MTSRQKLILVKSLHTGIWIFFNGVIFYLLYAVIAGRIDIRVWICIGLVFAEGLVLAFNGFRCPLTNIAWRYTQDRSANFDIYLPRWLAQHNKSIYTGIFGIAIAVLVYRLLNS